MKQPLCELCGNPMPKGEEMFKFHGYSGDCPPKVTGQLATDTQQVTEPVEIAPKSPQANIELDEILALIQLEIDYADTHGGCPPAVKGVTRKGVAEAKARLLAWNKASNKAAVEYAYLRGIEKGVVDGNKRVKAAVVEARIDELKRAAPFINSSTYLEARDFELSKEQA